jgi:hypothetical protein
MAVISSEPCDEKSNQAAFGNMVGKLYTPKRDGFLPPVEMTLPQSS